METAVMILANYWGLIALVVGLGAWALLDWQGFKKQITAMILYVEKHAEELCLEDGAAKHEWVVEHTYPYLPVWLKKFVTLETYHNLVEAIFQKLVALAEKHKRG